MINSFLLNHFFTKSFIDKISVKAKRLIGKIFLKCAKLSDDKNQEIIVGLCGTKLIQTSDCLFVFFSLVSYLCSFAFGNFFV